MGKIWDVVQGLKPAMMMVTVQIGLAGVNIFYKLAGNTGISIPVLIAYRFLFAAAFVIPLALLLDSKKKKPKLTWNVVLLAFICGLFGGSMAQNMYAKALVLTSATFAAAMTNIIPAVTFILAILFRMEGLGLKTWAGKAKIMGTCLCIGGAMVLTFYKGFEVKVWSTNFDLLNKSQHPGGPPQKPPNGKNNIIGFFLAMGCCFSSSFALICQSKMGKVYPYHYSSTAIISLMGAVQASVYGVCVERDWSQWRIGWNVKLLAAAYMGIVASGVLWAFMMLCVRMKGPLFVSVFNPLMLVLVALFSSLFLNEKLYLGSFLGAVIIICGLYSVLWGKGKEMRKINKLVPSNSTKKSSSAHHQNNNNVLDHPHINKPHEVVGDDQSFKGFNGESTNYSVLALAPSFLPEPTPELFEIFDGGGGGDDDEEEGKDVEKQIPKSNPQAKN
ncbi:WAT1-related protein At1g25270-like [Andrographis paniculata]|uniref:WAT1-related protein At1g25270-like n=1 Tax=Andrographis paniculata TaxID=175694 RepID=UPI0021E92B1D|nr:WAT1-related protein At1g25270-like [Andrographis paniculata]